MKGVSIDPGTNYTGYCVWLDGLPTEKGILSPPKSATTYLQKAFSIFGQVTDLLERVNPDAVAIEALGTYHNRDKKTGVYAGKEAMMKCCGIQMGIAWAARLHCQAVGLVSKGSISKKQSIALAKSFGMLPLDPKLNHTDDIDALQIGVCAGFDRKA